MFSRGRMLADKAVASSSKQAPKLMSRESTKAGTSRSKDILNSITKPVSKFLQLGKSKKDQTTLPKVASSSHTSTSKTVKTIVNTSDNDSVSSVTSNTTVSSISKVKKTTIETSLIYSTLNHDKMFVGPR